MARVSPTTPGSWEQSDFGDRGALDMAIGPVRGVRWWSLDDGGSLIGAYNGRWHGGENVGECGRLASRMQFQGILRAAMLGVGAGQPISHHNWWRTAVNVVPEKAGPEHEAADPSCVCGYYAFWRPEPLPLYEQYVVLGVIEGYGQTVIGTRGFRCQKARILGLHLMRSDWGDALDVVRTAWLERAGRGPTAHVQRIYNVPTYTSVRALLDAHPPTQDYAALPTAP